MRVVSYCSPAVAGTRHIPRGRGAGENEAVPLHHDSSLKLSQSHIQQLLDYNIFAMHHNCIVSTGSILCILAHTCWEHNTLLQLINSLIQMNLT